MYNSIAKFLLATAVICCGTPGFAQSKAKASKKQATVQTAAAKPADPVESITETIDRIYNYLDGCTPAAVIDKDGKPITDLSKIDENSSFQKGSFGINTYEWGVTYSGMLMASEVLGDEKYSKYVYDRLNLIGSVYPHAKDYYEQTGYQMRFTPLVSPKWLDDCGAMTAAMIKATIAHPDQSKGFRALLDNWYNFCYYKEYRMGDGILARHRPATNSVWLDDMYMGITPIAFRGRLSQIERGDLTQQYYQEAINQCLLFKKYLWVPKKNIYRHGWIEGMSEHPDYHWARANGWAVLTLCDVLDVVPPKTQGWNEVLELLKSLLRGIASYQSPEGTWHQLLDKTESYLETSASAMFVYGYAHAVNKGWIDRTAYQDIAKSGWAGVARQVNALGQVENTCVGTGLGWTNTFYEGRPVSVFAAHGYGPVLLAAAEMIKLYRNPAPPRVNYYANPTAAPREDSKPVVFLCGDSTCKNGAGDGSNGQWGWGSFFGDYLTDGVHVENWAIGGLSSRTFFDRQWPALRVNIREGDFVLIQFGHNDMSPINTGRARGTYAGTDEEPHRVVMEKDGSSETVWSYGHYIRTMIRQTKLRGGIPIVLSPTPQNRWDGDKLQRFDDSYNAWCRQVAEEEGVIFIDINDILAARYELIGQAAASSDYFADVVHTVEKGAKLYCKAISQALRDSASPLAAYVK